MLSIFSVFDLAKSISCNNAFELSVFIDCIIDEVIVIVNNLILNTTTFLMLLDVYSYKSNSMYSNRKFCAAGLTSRKSNLNDVEAFCLTVHMTSLSCVQSVALVETNDPTTV